MGMGTLSRIHRTQVWQNTEMYFRSIKNKIPTISNPETIIDNIFGTFSIG